MRVVNSVTKRQEYDPAGGVSGRQGKTQIRAADALNESKAAIMVGIVDGGF